MYEKLNFSGFVVMAAVAFCLVLQFTANDLGSRKSATIHFNSPLVFVPMVFLFLLCILIWIFYSEENNQNHQPIMTSQPIYAVKTDFVSQVYIIHTKIHGQNKNTVGAKTMSV